MSPESNARIAVDAGGIFTDLTLNHDHSLFTAKVPITQHDPMRGDFDTTSGKATRFAVVLQHAGNADKQATRHQRKP